MSYKYLFLWDAVAKGRGITGLRLGTEFWETEKILGPNLPGKIIFFAWIHDLSRFQTRLTQLPPPLSKPGAVGILFECKQFLG